MRLLLLLAVLSMVLACATEIGSPRATVKVDVLPKLPYPTSNNAVAAVATAQGGFLVSFNGLAAGRAWNDTHAHSYVLRPKATAWQRVDDVPGRAGRLASVAVGVGSHAYVFGGYTVAEDHTEVSLPLVHRYDPITGQFEQLSDMPVPVDDAVALAYLDRYIYLVSGWHDSANVNLVQRYDTQNDQWDQATAWPGAPVFGQAGGIVGNQLVVCDGVKINVPATGNRSFVMNNECFIGTIRTEDSRRIDWHALPAHPGNARYRMAAVGSELLNGVVFVGGSDNPYNYDGIGYNGEPSEPVGKALLYDLKNNRWKSLGQQVQPSMDHRGLLEVNQQFIVIGGMHSEQNVTDAVHAYKFEVDTLAQ